MLEQPLVLTVLEWKKAREDAPRPLKGAIVKISGRLLPMEIEKQTDENGRVEFEGVNFRPGIYQLSVSLRDFESYTGEIHLADLATLSFTLQIRKELASDWQFELEIPPGEVVQGQTIKLSVHDLPIREKGMGYTLEDFRFENWRIEDAHGNTYLAAQNLASPYIATMDTATVPSGSYTVKVAVKRGSRCFVVHEPSLQVKGRGLSPTDTIAVALQRPGIEETPDLALWQEIRTSTARTSWNAYANFMGKVLCDDSRLEGFDKKHISSKRSLPFPDTDRYRVLKVATEVFLMQGCGVKTDGAGDGRLFELELDRVGKRIEAVHPMSQYLETVMHGDRSVKVIPYLALVLSKLRDVPIKAAEKDAADACYGLLQEKLENPCFLELIWSYWNEEGMLVQTMNAIARRFQNVRGPAGRDPLAMLETDPLRPLNNMLWGYIQDEQHRLSLQRRAYEYQHHYGLSMQGQAVPRFQAAEVRSQFLEAFHNLLTRCIKFYQEADNTTIIADGFPVLNGLKEVHIILTEGMHNQYGDLPWTARQEMLMQQWILARPEFREFLPTRIMVALPEPWMDRVDAMKAIQGWTDTSIMHFRDLAVYGEQVLLSVRFGPWSSVNNRDQAANWALYWRDEIQGYIHAYRSVTGVDLSMEITDARQAEARALPPSVHLRNRLAAQMKKRVTMDLSRQQRELTS